ncbi:monovalent cation/H+ antiporter subunit D family protein [Desulfobacula toluolica]|uniref:MnhA: Na(+)/H(+) antiporter, subunit A (Mnh complex subunit A) n=1 Tax=Desulfobacula toluolica (strain DSM 7467 / Tol2) TaxID=651182 RepID=K0N9G0_DESTT|nr:monovalent cation/H+ antiporter subunit D family protein [Desulfobacula toluolica]CCK80544.1 MnhA: Na(+)/H(+) antiporter, subunit A (Mnh complex subunit A) [Desulfobacula toluolica Tol2]
METIISIKPLLAVLVSLCVIPLLLSSSEKPNVRESWIFIAGTIKFLIVISMLPQILQGKQIVLTLFEIAPGADIAFRVDALGMLFALVASSLYIITSIYSIGYMRGLNEHGQTRFVSFFALAISATIGAAFSANLLTLYLFYEMLSLATYPLVTHHQDAKSKISGRKYLIFILGTSIGLVLPAMIYCYHVTGTLEFAAGGIFTDQISKPSATVLLLMFVFGFAKAGIMPFHSWLPAAMVAPTPVSALLHAVAVVKVGAFSIVRVITGIFGIDFLLSFNLGAVVAAVASITILVSSCIALTQDEFKRRLAYSTIGQLSYIILGVTLLSPKGMTGGMLHIAMHAFGKITLFFCAGAIFVATGKKYISQLVGVGKRMPITMTAFFIGSLSIIGLPPTGGFISKWYLVLGTLEGDQMIMLFVLLSSSLLNAAYFMPVFYKAFFCTKEESMFEDKMDEAPMMCVVPLVITALISFVLFFAPQPFLNLAQLAVKGFLGG